MTSLNAARVRSLVGQFLTNYSCWVGIDADTGGQGLCEEASDELVGFLRRDGLWAEARWIDMVAPTDRGRRPLLPHHRYPSQLEDGHAREHCVVLVDGLVVDLTARQYDDELPFPFIWEAP